MEKEETNRYTVDKDFEKMTEETVIKQTLKIMTPKQFREWRKKK